jgi:quercetin dioxygenase-like cupin family protein
MTGEGLARAVADSETVMLGPNRVTFLLGGSDTGGRFALTEFVMAPPPAPGPPLHVHAAEEEAVYLIDGQLKVTLGGAASPRLDRRPRAPGLQPRLEGRG